MNIRFKLAIFFAASICAAVLYFIKFEQNIRAIGFLSFIGTPTIVVVVICHVIAFLIRLLLVRYHCRSLGVNRGNEALLSDLLVTNKELFLKIKKSFNKGAALFFLSMTVTTSVMYFVFISLKNMPRDELERHIMQYQTAYVFLNSVSLISIAMLLFFAVHFLVMSSFLEYKSKVKAIFVTILSYQIVMLSLDYLAKLWGS